MKKLITDRFYLWSYQGTEWIFQVREFHYAGETQPFSVYGERGYICSCINLEQAKRVMIVHTRNPNVKLIEIVED